MIVTPTTNTNSAPEILARAVAAHQSRSRNEAKPLYLEALKHDPNNAHARYLLGVLYYELQDFERAHEQLQLSLSLRPNDLPTQTALGAVLSTMNCGEEALKVFQAIAQAAPHDPDSFSNLGQAFLNLKRYGDAATSYERALSLQPHHGPAILGMADCAKAEGQKERAIAVLEDGISRIPDFTKAQILLSRLLLETRQDERADQVLTSLLGRQPVLTDALLLLGNLRYRQVRLKDAEALYRRLTVLAPNEPVANNYLGATLQNLGRLDEAEEYVLKAHRVAPDDPEILTNLGLIYQDRGDTIKAVEFQRRALAIKPTMAEAWNNLGIALQNIGEWDEALASYRQAVALKPHFIGAKSNIAHALLSLGRFSEGWNDYHYRFDKKYQPSKRRQFDYPVWTGEPIPTATLLLWTDQGLGDEVLFSSMIPDALERCGTCLLECSPRLAPLMQRSFARALVVPRTNPPHVQIEQSAPDYQLSLGELGRIFRPDLQSIPRHNGYLKADEAARNALRLKYEKHAQGRRIVGISWKSENPNMGRTKTLALPFWEPILAVKDILFVAVQYGDVIGDLNAINDGRPSAILHDPDVKPTENPDLSAAQISAMDLVITVSNTTAHFAGALNVPVWTLVPKGPGLFWYWFHVRDDSPWYPSMTLFRQDRPGVWDGAVARVAQRLAEWAARR